MMECQSCRQNKAVARVEFGTVGGEPVFFDVCEFCIPANAGDVKGIYPLVTVASAYERSN